MKPKDKSLSTPSETELLVRIKSISADLGIPIDDLFQEAIVMLLAKYKKTS